MDIKSQEASSFACSEVGGGGNSFVFIRPDIIRLFHGLLFPQANGTGQVPPVPPPGTRRARRAGRSARRPPGRPPAAAAAPSAAGRPDAAAAHSPAAAPAAAPTAAGAFSRRQEPAPDAAAALHEAEPAAPGADRGERMPTLISPHLKLYYLFPGQLPPGGEEDP